jgi:hypothetical protein
MPGPQYPIYPSTPYTGDLPSQLNMGPFDLYPSSSTGPAYQRRFDSMYGRHLAGAEKPVGSDEEPAYALNELRLMAEMDDVDGNGVFDPPGTRPQLYPDAGIMASSYSRPGYLARERMYAPSEVVDANTGRPVTYVNGGMVSMDSTAEIAFMEGGAYRAPRPYLDILSEQMMEGRSTVNVAVNQVPVRIPGPPPNMPMAPMAVPDNAADSGAKAGLGAMSDTGKLVLILGGIGLAAGVAYAASRPKMTANKKRRRR